MEVKKCCMCPLEATTAFREHHVCEPCAFDLDLLVNKAVLKGREALTARAGNGVRADMVVRAAAGNGGIVTAKLLKQIHGYGPARAARQLYQMVRRPGLIAKVPGTHKYELTAQGWERARRIGCE